MGLEEIRNLKQKSTLPKEKKIYYIPKKSPKRIEQEKKQRDEGSDGAMDMWFDHFMEHSEPVCENCGMRADWLKEEKYELLWRSCQAHLLPKRKVYGFPSLAANRDNHLVLFPSFGGTLCGCHGAYDSCWQDAATMDIWEKVKDVFKTKLYALIPENEKKNIPEQLLKEIQ